MNSDKEKLFGVTIDKHLKFESYIKHLCSKGSQRIYALSSVSLYMNLNQRRKIMQPVLMSQFGPLIWMNHNRSLNNNINRIH